MLDAHVREVLKRPPSEVSIALVGASDEPRKYGNIIRVDLERKGYRVHAVNPKRASVGGRPAFVRVEDVPDPVDIVDFVVPATVAYEVLGDLDPRRYEIVWLQPGSFDPRTKERAETRFSHAVVGSCIMVETR